AELAQLHAAGGVDPHDPLTVGLEDEDVTGLVVEALPGPHDVDAEGTNGLDAGGPAPSCGCLGLGAAERDEGENGGEQNVCVPGHGKAPASLGRLWRTIATTSDASDGRSRSWPCIELSRAGG